MREEKKINFYLKDRNIFNNYYVITIDVGYDGIERQSRRYVWKT